MKKNSREFGIFFIIHLLLSIFLYLFRDKLLIHFLILLTINISIFFIYRYKTLKKVFIDFSNLISSLNDKRPYKPYVNFSDNLLSKLQDQILQLFSDLKLAKEKSHNEKEELSSLISDISHQIKTPLTSLNLYNDLLKKSHGDKKELQQEFDRGLKHLTWLIENLMILSRVETGIIQINKEDNDITQSLLRSIKRVSHQSENKKIVIKYNRPISQLLKYDEKWTSEAIYNILDNAVKYSPNNKEIFIKTEKRELYYLITIIDSGIGIKKSELNSIFKRFYRGSNVKNLDGVGIGLSLSQKIMNFQNGYINCKSNMNKGSEFTIFISRF